MLIINIIYIYRTLPNISAWRTQRVLNKFTFPAPSVLLATYETMLVYLSTSMGSFMFLFLFFTRINDKKCQTSRFYNID